MQAQLRHQQLQTAVLVFHRLQPLRLAHVHAAVLRLPAIERRRADPMLAAQIRRLHSRLMLLQYPDDLLFRIPALLHLWSSPSHYERTPAAIGRDFRGQVISPYTNTHNRAATFLTSSRMSGLGPNVRPAFSGLGIELDILNNGRRFQDGPRRNASGSWAETQTEDGGKKGYGRRDIERH